MIDTTIMISASENPAFNVCDFILPRNLAALYHFHVMVINQANLSLSLEPKGMTITIFCAAQISLSALASYQPQVLRQNQANRMP